MSEEDVIIDAIAVALEAVYNAEDDMSIEDDAALVFAVLTEQGIVMEVEE